MIYISDTNRSIRIQSSSAKSLGDYSIKLVSGITQAEYVFSNIEDNGTTAYYLFTLSRGIVDTMANGEYHYTLYRDGNKLYQGVLVKEMAADADFVYETTINDFVYEDIQAPEYPNAILFDNGSILSFDNNDVIIYTA